MHLSAPIYRLKHQAKLIAREHNLALHAALDRVAQQEGYPSWSLLTQRERERSPSKVLVAGLKPGDLVLLGARQGHGKTLLGLEFLIDTMRTGTAGAMFTLEYTRAEVEALIASLGEDPDEFAGRFSFHDGDISAGYLQTQLAQAAIGTAVLIDFLQLMDQYRAHPPLAEQVEILRSFGRERGLVIVCIAQIDRSYDPAENRVPGLGDVRLPNPVDLSLFNRTCFLHEGEGGIT